MKNLAENYELVTMEQIEATPFPERMLSKVIAKLLEDLAALAKKDGIAMDWMTLSLGSRLNGQLYVRASVRAASTPKKEG